MSALRVGVVAAGDDGWAAELPLVLQQICGALAMVADVTLLRVTAEYAAPRTEGAFRIRSFVGPTPEPRRALALRRACFGPDGCHDGAIDCDCTAVLQRRMATELPVAAQRALLRATGGDSPELFTHLASLPYDTVVFAGCASASTYWGLQAVAGRQPTVVLAGAVNEPTLWMPVVADVLDAADGVLVTGECEAEVLTQGAPALKPEKIGDIGFVLHVAELASRTPPFGFDGRPAVVVVGDWNEPGHSRTRLVSWAARLQHHLGGRASVRFVGPGVQRLPRGVRAEFASSRVDSWRWMARAIAVIDPEPQRLIGRSTVEALLYGVPVLVPADGGASRRHAEAGNGGLWYRSYGELLAGVEALLEDDVRTTLGRQGQDYAAHRFTDTERYIQGVQQAVLGASEGG